jgi:hypothetical protein
MTKYRLVWKASEKGVPAYYGEHMSKGEAQKRKNNNVLGKRMKLKSV